MDRRCVHIQIRHKDKHCQAYKARFTYNTFDWTLGNLYFGKQRLIRWMNNFKNNPCREWQKDPAASSFVNMINQYLEDSIGFFNSHNVSEHLHALIAMFLLEIEELDRLLNATNYPELVGAFKFMKAQLVKRLEYLKEIIFEKVRRQGYPDLPSRSECIFLLRLLDEDISKYLGRLVGVIK